MVIINFLQCGTVTYAREENERGVIVSAIFDDDNQYNLSVVVHKWGSVIDGTQSIREGIVDYSLPLDTRKEFKILPDEGFQIKSVTFQRPELDGEIEDITQMLDDGMYRFDVESTQMKLEVTFEKIEGGQPPVDNEKPPNNTETSKPGNLETDPVQRGLNKGQPSTGDHFMTSFMMDLFLLIGTWMILCLLWKRKKEDSDTENTYKR